MNFNIKKLFVLLALLILDTLVFFVLALFLMNYEDNYDELKGDFWSLNSMDTTEKLLYIIYLTWIVINLVGLIYLCFKLIKTYINKKPQD